MDHSQSVMPLSTPEDDIMQLVTSLSQTTSGVCEINPSDKKIDQIYIGQSPQLPSTAHDHSSPMTPESSCGSVVSDPSIADGLTPSVSPSAFPGSKYAPPPGSLPQGIKLPQRKGGMQLWQFLYAVLEEGHTGIIKYTEDKSGLEFRIVDPDTIAAWWGYQKNHKNMNFDKFSRSLRYYYERKLIQRVYGEKFVYRFCCHPEYLYDVLDSSDCRPKLKPLSSVMKHTFVKEKGLVAKTELPDWDNFSNVSPNTLSPGQGIQQAYSPASVSPARSLSPIPPAHQPSQFSPANCDSLQQSYWSNSFNTAAAYSTSHPTMWPSATSHSTMPYLAVPSVQQPSAFYSGYGNVPTPAGSAYQKIQVNSGCVLTVPSNIPYASSSCDSYYQSDQQQSAVSPVSSPGLETAESTVTYNGVPAATCDMSPIMPVSTSYSAPRTNAYYNSQPLHSRNSSLSTAGSPVCDVVSTNAFSSYPTTSQQQPASTMPYNTNCSDFYHFNEKL